MGLNVSQKCKNGHFNQKRRTEKHTRQINKATNNRMKIEKKTRPLIEERKKGRFGGVSRAHPYSPVPRVWRNNDVLYF